MPLERFQRPQGGAVIFTARIPLRVRLLLFLPALALLYLILRHPEARPVEAVKLALYLTGLWGLCTLCLTELRITDQGLGLHNPVAGSQVMSWRELGSVQTGRRVGPSSMNAPVVVRFRQKDGRKALDLGVTAWERQDLVKLLRLAQSLCPGLSLDAATRAWLDHDETARGVGYLGAYELPPT